MGKFMYEIIFTKLSIFLQEIPLKAIPERESELEKSGILFLRTNLNPIYPLPQDLINVIKDNLEAPIESDYVKVGSILQISEKTIRNRKMTVNTLESSGLNMLVSRYANERRSQRAISLTSTREERPNFDASTVLHEESSNFLDEILFEKEWKKELDVYGKRRPVSSRIYRKQQNDTLIYRLHEI